MKNNKPMKPPITEITKFYNTVNTSVEKAVTTAATSTGNAVIAAATSAKNAVISGTICGSRAGAPPTTPVVLTPTIKAEAAAAAPAATTAAFTKAKNATDKVAVANFNQELVPVKPDDKASVIAAANAKIATAEADALAARACASDSVKKVTETAVVNTLTTIPAEPTTSSIPQSGQGGDRESAKDGVNFGEPQSEPGGYPVEPENKGNEANAGAPPTPESVVGGADAKVEAAAAKPQSEQVVVEEDTPDKLSSEPVVGGGGTLTDKAGAVVAPTPVEPENKGNGAGAVVAPTPVAELPSENNSNTPVDRDKCNEKALNERSAPEASWRNCMPSFSLFSYCSSICTNTKDEIVIEQIPTQGIIPSANVNDAAGIPAIPSQTQSR